MLYLHYEQNMEMWGMGFLTLSDGRWICYHKMEDLKPLDVMESPPPLGPLAAPCPEGDNLVA